MKKFEVYRNIRKRAMIFGLPISLFALQILSIVGSLMVIIFSFSLSISIIVFVFNTLLYVFLTRITIKPIPFLLFGTFPKIISNKKSTSLNYGED
ncbi:hypothetical protein DHD08_12090 [Arenibacter sp. H213]|nr:hypothetical protein [Arenibacter sp. H213]MCM4168421.1 hypothetical protein [Arenibacter sp. H213]